MKNRRSIRLAEYDYSWPGAYFLTISTLGHRPMFGKIRGEEVELSRQGKIAEQCWHDIPKHLATVEIDAFIVMPNHVHGILWITESRPRSIAVGAQHAAPVQPKRPRVDPGTLGAVVRSYKSAVSRAIHQLPANPNLGVWHRNYYERVIRDDRELESIRTYIVHNALKDCADLKFQEQMETL
ncbi:MAG: hypothetical protein WD751_07010 [Anaerolineales bacterium]